MSTLSDLFPEEFSTLSEEWLKSLKSELKIDQVDSKTVKKQLEGGAWPTLSLGVQNAQHLSVSEVWKKSSQTYLRLPSKNLEKALIEDLDSGVRVFFFYKQYLASEQLNLICTIFEKFPKKEELLLILLGEESASVPKTSFKIFDESKFISARIVEEQGGNIVQELGFITRKMILEKSYLISLFVDSNFFKNIAKIRAAKLLAKKVQEELASSEEIKIIALTSFRDWSLYERYSNLLRNDAAVASAYIGGADYVQSAGYDSLFEIEIDDYQAHPEHTERSRRMARNTTHILALESMLGVVQDPSFGSFHLESLSQYYAKEAWSLMQKTINLDERSCLQYFSESISSIRNQRLDNIKMRRHVLAGVNDFPNVKENLNLKHRPKEKFFRSARIFEELRIEMENSPVRPKVYLLINGDYAALNARINFVRNYFELLGLEVIESRFSDSLKASADDFLVLCASDDGYENLKNNLPEFSGEKFIAGKYELNGFKNLFAGQNVYSVLESIVQKVRGK
ncbi:MAG: methylmalonyl-CoA mutase family protein [Bacteriovoracaceae bacterium]